MKNKIIFLVSVVILIASCSSDNEESVKINLANNLSGSPVNSDFSLNEIVEDISFVQLEDNDSLGSIYPYLWSINDNGDYCFVDFANKMVISIYNKEGKLVSTFNNTGKGPNEYIYPASVLFDGDDEVTIMATYEKFIYKYDKKGVIKSKIPISNIIDIHDIGNGKYLTRASTLGTKCPENLVLTIDSAGKICDKFLPMDTTAIDWTYYNGLATKGDGGYNFPIQRLSKSAYYNYNIETNEVTEWCEFDLGDYGMKADSKIEKMSDYDNFFMSLDLSKVGDYLFSAFMYKNTRFCDIWDIKTGENFARRVIPYGKDGVLSTFQYTLPNGNNLELTLYPTFAHEGKLYHSVMPSVLIKAGVEGINPDGNLVYIIMTLKNLPHEK